MNVSLHDPLYPSALKEIHDPPNTLFVRGTIPPLEHGIAIVGSRKNTLYGKQITEDITRILVHAGCPIVSGLAFGIDSIAHETTLKTGGITVAVLGSGVDDESITPRTHTRLAQEIIAHGGAVISEYPPRTPSSKFTYPKRNRIIAGLSRATIVIEAAEGSGALITAQCATDNGRDVFAVPQSITSLTSRGVNELIATGATPIVDPEELLDLLQLRSLVHSRPNEKTSSKRGTLPVEHTILALLEHQPLHLDELIAQSGIQSHALMGVITMMELQGVIRRLGGMMYARM